ncbi:outer membrane beta-barrel protein [Magnetospirillum sp. 64-120]|uniref:outer membrane beta-barrel protein n=1 Tax=Magnetospirillum sp. 64-120 TaxID=1895778 RepID=UPI0025C0018A|nr:outer membrane beta-barrel protein [Magnetospirillum sp. 64-120]
MSPRYLAFGIGVILAAGCGTALAQDDVKGTGLKSESVRKQKDGLLPPKDALEQKDGDIAPDQYQPQGVALGSFLLLPKAEVDLTRNNNIYASNYDRVGDFLTAYRSEAVLKSDFQRHEVTAQGRIERKEFHNYDRESVTNSYLRLAGRYDFTPRDVVNLAVFHTRDHEDRGSLDDAGGLRPTEYQYLTLDASGVMNTGNLTSSLGFLATNRQWDDTRTSTGVTPSHFRNRNDYELKLREAYEFIPGYAALVEATGIQRRYEHDRDQSGYRRDSDGVRLATGLGLDISEVIRGDVLGGYMWQDYEDARLGNVSGAFFKVMLNWMPTRLTTVIPSLERSIEETTASGVAALLSTAASVTVRHELQRNIILGSTLSYSEDEQKNGELTAHTYTGTVRATYLLNSSVYASAEMTEKHKLSNIDGRGFNQTIGMLRLGLQY